MNPEKSKLKSCPFCGEYPKYDDSNVYVYCANRKCFISHKIFDCIGWNTRTKEPDKNLEVQMPEVQKKELDEKEVMGWYANIAEPQNLSTIVVLKFLCDKFVIPQAIPDKALCVNLDEYERNYLYNLVASEKDSHNDGEKMFLHNLKNKLNSPCLRGKQRGRVLRN